MTTNFMAEEIELNTRLSL